jgi:hypothetical protein
LDEPIRTVNPINTVFLLDEPIRTVNPINTVFLLDDFGVRVQKSYSKVIRGDDYTKYVHLFPAGLTFTII